MRREVHLRAGHARSIADLDQSKSSALTGSSSADLANSFFEHDESELAFSASDDDGSDASDSNARAESEGTENRVRNRGYDVVDDVAKQDDEANLVGDDAEENEDEEEERSSQRKSGTSVVEVTDDDDDDDDEDDDDDDEDSQDFDLPRDVDQEVPSSPALQSSQELTSSDAIVQREEDEEERALRELFEEEIRDRYRISFNELTERPLRALGEGAYG